MKRASSWCLGLLALAACGPPDLKAFTEGAVSVDESRPTIAFQEAYNGQKLAAGDGGGVTPDPGGGAGPDPDPKGKPPSGKRAGWDIDMKRGAPQPGAFAIVIGVGTYRGLPEAKGADTDAARFAKLASTTLGVPPKNIAVLTNDRASKSDIDKKIAWISNNIEDDGRIYFFFAGHGESDTKTSAAYLLPWDADPDYVAVTGYSLDGVLETLSKTKAKQVVAFVDACYSGAGGRSVHPTGGRAISKVVEPTVKTAPAASKVALFSSAQAAEISGPLPGENVGLFTHMVVRAVGAGEADVDGDGNVTLDEAAQWVPVRVNREAKRDNREQTPKLQVWNGFDAKKFSLASGI